MKQTVHVPSQHAFLFPSGALHLKNIPMTCSNKDVYSEFQFPRKVEENKLIWYAIQYYECCKTGSKVQPPFIDDYTFKETVYPQIAVSTVAVLSLLLLITALLFIPLWLYLRESCESTNNNNTTTTTDTRTNPN